jgi:hypothetical protein
MVEKANSGKDRMRRKIQIQRKIMRKLEPGKE